MGILVTGLLILALTSILGLAYIALPNQTKFALKEFLNNVD